MIFIAKLKNRSLMRLLAWEAKTGSSIVSIDCSFIRSFVHPTIRSVLLLSEEKQDKCIQHAVPAAIYLMTNSDFENTNGTGILHEFVIPVDFVFTSGFHSSDSFAWSVPAGSYYLWIQGQGATRGGIVILLEFTEDINFTSNVIVD